MKQPSWRWLGALAGAVLLVGPPAARAEQFQDNVVIVLDASGSMKERLSGTSMTKMDAAKMALKEVLAGVPASTHMGLLVFSAANLKDDWAYPLGPRDETALVAAIDRILPSSGTPLGKYLKRGADRLLEERQRQFGYGTFRLLVVTDGEAQDRALVDRFAPEIVARGITLDVIGVGMRDTHTLAKKAHSYRAANDPASLKRAIQEVFAEIGSGTGDESSTELFDLIAPIPPELAAAAIQALSTTGNQPIGDKPAPTRAAADQRTPGPTATSRPSTPGNPAPPGPPQQPVSHGRSSKKFPTVLVVVLAVLLVVVRAVMRGARR